jgi:pyridoxal phosphate enzyme (YggS family)
MSTKKQIIEENITNVISQAEIYRKEFSRHQIVKLVAISKYNSSDDIKVAFSVGQRAFGESKIQDLKIKQQELDDIPIEWHFIGRLQTNKINALIDSNIFLLHSLDSLKLAEELDKRLKIKDKKLNVLIQINSSNDKNQAGFEVEEALKNIEQIENNYTNLRVKGLMCIGANTEQQDKIEQSFSIVTDIFNKIKNNDISILSMGMSSDYKIAISKGSNMIRVGSLIFKQKG